MTSRVSVACSIWVLSLAACGIERISPREASQIARAHIASAAEVESASLELSEISAREHEGDTAICGVVSGPTISLRRFIVIIRPNRSVMFERAAQIGLSDTYDFNSQWKRICRRSAELETSQSS